VSQSDQFGRIKLLREENVEASAHPLAFNQTTILQPTRQARDDPLAVLTWGPAAVFSIKAGAEFSRFLG
jgi:hypothetical protein